jgi:hypothetical protein
MVAAPAKTVTGETGAVFVPVLKSMHIVPS